MPSNAINAQGSTLEIQTGTGAAKTITGVSLANPCVITSTAHGLQPGDVVTFAGVGGTTQLNGTTAVVEYVTANTFSLVGVNSTGYSAFTSGGTATPVTWTQVAEIKGISGFDGQASEIDITNLSSTAKEKRLGLMDFGGVNLDISKVPSDAGQQAIATAYSSGALKNFRFKLPAGTASPNTATFSGMVKQNSMSLGVDGVVGGSVSITISGAVAWA